MAEIDSLYCPRTRGTATLRGLLKYVNIPLAFSPGKKTHPPSRIARTVTIGMEGRSFEG